jgi:hypothetical protein
VSIDGFYVQPQRVGQGDKGLIKSQKATVQEIIVDFAAILNKINLVLNDHEQRLHLIEDLDLKIELDLLRRRITVISDSKKQTMALQAFKNLCGSLGISDLEFVQA